MREKLVSINKKKLLAFLLLLAITSVYYYSDTNSIIHFGIDFWKALFSGRFFNLHSVFYESELAGRAGASDGYGIIMTLLLAIWQFPLYIIEHFAQVNVLDFFIARIWGKSYLLIILYMCAKEIEKISLVITNGNTKQSIRAFWLFVFNPFTISSVCVIGQADIMGVWFSLLALRYLYNNDKKHFYIYLILATSTKYFPLFCFIPIFLLYEKKIWKSVTLILLPIAINYLCNLPFQLIDSRGFSKDNIEGIIGMVFGNTVAFANNDIPIIITLYGIVCIMAFITNPQNDEDRITWSLWYLVLSGLSVFNLLCYPYRIVLLIPFVILLMARQSATSQEYIIETVATVSLALGMICSFFWCYDIERIQEMLVNTIVPLNKFEINNLYSIISSIDYEYTTAPYSIFLACIVVLIIKLCPLYKRQTIACDSSEKSDSIVLYVRNILGVLLPCIAICFYVFAFFEKVVLHFVS